MLNKSAKLYQIKNQIDIIIQYPIIKKLKTQYSS